MSIIFTKHILEKYYERYFTIELLSDILRDPDAIENQSDGIDCYKKIIGNYIHLLYVKIEWTDYKLITYIKSSKIKKYI